MLLGKMKKSHFNLLLVVGLALGHTAFAAPIDYPAPGDAPQQPSPATGAQGSLLSKAISKGWVSRCLSESRTGPLECSMQQLVVLPNSSQAVLSLIIRTTSPGAVPVLGLQLPFGILLTGGASIQLDAHQPHAMPIETCEAQGCFAELSLKSDILNEFKTSNRMTVRFENVSKKQVSVPIELNNFGDVFSRIQ